MKVLWGEDWGSVCLCSWGHSGCLCCFLKRCPGLLPKEQRLYQQVESCSFWKVSQLQIISTVRGLLLWNNKLTLKKKKSNISHWHLSIAEVNQLAQIQSLLFYFFLKIQAPQCAKQHCFGFFFLFWRFFGCRPFAQSLLKLLEYRFICLCSCFLAMRHMGILAP